MAEVPGGSGTCKNRSALIDGTKYNQGFSMRAVIQICLSEESPCEYVCVHVLGVYNTVCTVFLTQLAVSHVALYEDT